MESEILAKVLNQESKMLATAYSLEGNYDYGGYWGLFLDFLSGDQQRYWTILLQSPEHYYCSEVIATCFEENNIPVSLRKSSLTSPLDLLYFTMGPDADWEIIEILELSRRRDET